MKKILIILILTFLFPITAQAANPDTNLLEMMRIVDFNEIDTIITGAGIGNRPSISELTLSALRGDLDLSASGVMNMVLGSLFREVADLLYLLRIMLVVAVLSGFFRGLSSSFSSSKAAHVGFLVNYVLVISLIFASFYVAVGVMQTMARNVLALLAAATPIIIAVLAASGYVAPAAGFAPMIMFITGFLTLFVERILVPVITLAAVFHLISYLADKDTFEPMVDSVKKGIKFSLKAVSLIFSAIVGIQHIATPIVNNLAIRGTRLAVGAVPVVGSALSGAIDAAILYGGAMRGALSVALLIGAAGIVIGPIISIAAFVLVYRLTAALIAPICEERIVKAVATAGDYAEILLGVCAMVGFMFVFITLAALAL